MTKQKIKVALSLSKTSCWKKNVHTVQQQSTTPLKCSKFMTYTHKNATAV